MSETPLTCPHQKNDVGGSFGGPPVRPIPHIQNGKVIREPIIRLESPTQRESYRGKGKAIDIGGDRVGCRADVILPRMSTTKSGYGGNGESSRAVRRRLFEEPLHQGDEDVEMEESGGEEPEPIEGGTITAPTPGAQPSSLYTWTRFQDSLHNLLNDQSKEHVLFARDAPPVIDSAEEDGKSEEEDRRGVKAQGDNEEMTEQDNVMIVTGSWVREDDGKWIFDSLTEEGTKSITLTAGFEEEWLDFAMSETSLTFPHQKNDVGGSFGGPLVRPIPHIQNGIVIREPIIRLESPTQRESYRGKGKAIDIGGDSVGCRADVILPRMSTTKSGYGGNGESSRAVRHRLFEEPLHRGDEDVEMEESGGEEPEPIEGGTIRAPTPGAQPSSLYTWMRFQDSLHNLLNDQSIEPVLFARDAPPVIDSAEEDGK
ncbi:hypothetical protein F2Q70_00002650 [Brassica cretica]|uniref:Uncharacterized protein n=1 Tax=Brassica cretica TaxID=69181 RepID=A0A8S9IY72_BRACR|nr:hypothetical protein F2Q70_00002650 [Brassica cretica]